MRERIAGYLIEPPTLFKGRGEHPKAGKMKSRIEPECLTLNIGEDAPIPKCLVPGHAWGEIVHKHDVTWLAGYKEDKINKHHKYIFLAANSKFKNDNDKKKYEKARKLKEFIKSVRENYERKLVDKKNEVNR